MISQNSGRWFDEGKSDFFKLSACMFDDEFEEY